MNNEVKPKEVEFQISQHEGELLLYKVVEGHKPMLITLTPEEVERLRREIA